MTTNNFYYASVLLELLYGITIPEESFEEIGLIAWNQIGNKRCKLYRYSQCLDGCTMEMLLPCNCDILEAVTTDFEDFEHVSNVHDRSKPGSFITELYIESRKAFKAPLYISGKYVTYERVGDTLYFTLPYRKINILYKGIQLDDSGLPELTDKEALAIATFVAYTTKFKEGIMSSNGNTIKIADTLKLLWLKQCDLARVPEEMSLNDWDEILDAKNSWDRKILNKTYKPVK